MLNDLLALFPSAASLCIAEPGLAAWPEEEKFLAHAAAKRCEEFVAGRAAARAALAKLGAPPAPVPVNPDRTPAWPAGFVGSISHCNGFCAAVVARADEIAGIGFDAEPAKPLPEGTDRMIYGAEEAAGFAALPASTPWPKLAFCAKEAFYKCFYPVMAKRIGFHDVAVRFDADGRFSIDAVRSEEAAAFLKRNVAGRWRGIDGFVFASFVLMPD